MRELTKVLESAIFKFAVGGKATFIEEGHKALIQVGVGALCSVNGDRAKLDKPVIIQAGINHFSLEKMADSNMAAQEDGGLGDAFEKCLLPAIQKRLSQILHDQLNHHGGSVLKDCCVSKRSSYGVLAIKCKDCVSTIKWIEAATSARFEGKVPPLCYPDSLMGPDLIFLMWNKTHTRFIAVLSQAKYRQAFNHLSALRTITPSLLCHEKRGEPMERKSPESV